MINKILSIVVLLCIMLSAIPTCADNSTPIAAWDFDTVNNGTISDITGNGYDIKVNTDDYIQEDGFKGKVIKFNSPYETNTSRHMTFNTEALATALNGVSQFTFTCMFKKLTDVTNLGEKDLLSLYFPEGKAAARIYLKENLIGIATRADVSEPSMSTVVARINIPGETDWYNLAVVFDYSMKNVKVYIDGGLYLDTEMPDWSSNTFNLKSHSAKNGLGCDAAIIDNVSIYNKSLLQSEIINMLPATLRLDMSTGINSMGGSINATIPSESKLIAGVNNLIAMQSGNTQFLIPNGGLGKKLSDAKATGVSVGFWIKGELPTTQQTLFRIFNSNGTSALDIKLDQHSKIEYGGRTDNDESNGREPYKSSTATVTWDSEKWHHIMCTTDFVNDVRKVYFDGTLVTESAAGHRKNFYSNGYSSNKSDLFGLKNMAFDDVVVFAKALEQQEIADIVNDRSNIAVFLYDEQQQYFTQGQLNGNGIADIVIYNNTAETQNGIIVAALTDSNNCMKQIKKLTVSSLTPGCECLLQTQFTDMINGDSVRLFYWDSLSSKNIISDFKEF